jgi:hypothetical protein
MALFKLLLQGFEFPASLAARNANFRFVFQLRHFDANESLVTTESVSPGLSTYWECDPAKEKGGGNQAKYIRDGMHPRFAAISPWDQLVLTVKSKELFQMRVSVFDVNRADWVDHLRQLGGELVGALVGAAKNAPLPSQLAAPVGTLLDQLREAVVGFLAKKDTMLFAVVYEFGTNQNSQSIDLTHDHYTMRLALAASGPAAAAPRGAAASAAPPSTSGRIDASSAFAFVPPPPGARAVSTKTSKKRARRRRPS